MDASELSGLIPECCRIGFASIEDYDEKEQKDIRALMPNVKTIIVIAHHVMHSLEFVWFRFSSERQQETCAADLHTKSIAEKICYKLSEKGYENVMPPYPGECGVMFGSLAVKTGLGELGKNYLFMNVDWGPWMHLRSVFTDAEIEYEKPVSERACDDCGKCIEVCPAGAIKVDDFDGLKCRGKMREIKSSLGDVPYLFECEKCMRVCPIGEQPREVVVSYVKK